MLQLKCKKCIYIVAVGIEKVTRMLKKVGAVDLALVFFCFGVSRCILVVERSCCFNPVYDLDLYVCCFDCPFNFFRFCFKHSYKDFKISFLSETVKRFLFPDWVQSMDVLPDWVHSIIVLPNWDTAKSENG